MPRLGLHAGDTARVAFLRGDRSFQALRDDRTLAGPVFVSSAFMQADAILLIIAESDSFGKTQEFKHCAARVTRV